LEINQHNFTWKYLLVLWAVDRINEIIQSLSISITWHYFFY
jgi:hypothetical protein